MFHSLSLLTHKNGQKSPHVEQIYMHTAKKFGLTSMPVTTYWWRWINTLSPCCIVEVIQSDYVGAPLILLVSMWVFEETIAASKNFKNLELNTIKKFYGNEMCCVPQ